MAYITPDDMITLFEEPELVEATNLRNASAVLVNMEKLQLACDSAQGIIDGWIGQRYSLPLTDLSEHLAQTLRIHAANIARHQLDGSTEEIRNKYKDAIEWLKWFSGNSTGSTGSNTVSSVNYDIRQQSDSKLSHIAEWF